MLSKLNKKLDVNCVLFYRNNWQDFGPNDTYRYTVTNQTLHPCKIQDNHELIALNFTISSTV